MSRRVSLPGADELFRTTGGMALQSSQPRRQANGDARVPAPAGEGDAAAAAAEDAPQSVPAQGGDGEGPEHVAADADPAEAGEAHSRSAAAERSGSAGRQTAQEGSAAGAAEAAAAGAGAAALAGVSAACAAPNERTRLRADRVRSFFMGAPLVGGIRRNLRRIARLQRTGSVRG